MINLSVARTIMRSKFANNVFLNFDFMKNAAIRRLNHYYKFQSHKNWISWSRNYLTSYFDLTKFDLLTPSHYSAFKLLKQWAIFILCEICIFKFCPTTKIARVFLTIHLSKLWVDNSHPNWLKTGCNKTNLRGFARKVNRKIININLTKLGFIRLPQFRRAIKTSESEALGSPIHSLVYFGRQFDRMFFKRTTSSLLN